MDETTTQETPQQTTETINKENSSKINFWMISTIVLAVLAIILIFFVKGSGGTTGNVISSNDIGPKAVDFINSQVLQGQGTVTLNSVNQKNGLYEVIVNYQNKTVPTYFTADGQYYVGTQIAPLTVATANTNSNTNTPAQPTSVTKSDKPEADIYVFAYCPYGLQFEKALFPVYDLLKSKANINVAYIGAMHGPFEETESLRQLAILKDYGNDKLIAYLKLFDTNAAIGNCNGDATCLSPLLDTIYTQLGIDKTKINADMTSTSPTAYAAAEAKASSLGITGSPTFVINGAQVQVNRDSESIKQAICTAFNTAPSECNQTLSSTASSPGFGDTAGASSGASCGTPA